MPDSAHLVAFLAAALTIALIPGPGVLYVLARTLGGGREAGLRSSFGTGIGGLAHVAAAAIGLSALIAASATAFTAVKYLGAAYLVYLGCRALLSRDREPAAAALDREDPLAQRARGRHVRSLVALGVASVTFNTLVDVFVAYGAGGLSRRLHSRPEIWRRQQVATGGILIGLGVYAAAAGHRSR